jgi:hypothetical protein
MNEATRGISKVRSVLYGDGVGVLKRATLLTLTNAQAKAFRATPITIVSAAGAGKLLMPVSCAVVLLYGGTNAFTQGGAGSNFSLKWKDGTTASIMTGGIGAFVQNTTSAVSQMVPAAAAGSEINVTKANADNQPLVVHNPAAAELTGNAGADNTFQIFLEYIVLPVAW